MAFKNISVILSAATGDLTRGLEKAAKEVEAFGTKAHSVNKNFLALGTVLGIAAVASVRMAADFQRAMELIHTQAGASQAEVDSMRNSILKLAPAVGEGPVKLADALYHIESIGLRGAKALDVLHTAAMGAEIGNADLETTTNALASTIASNIGGFHGMKDAMAVLNNTVGQGNMRMDDLAASMSTGVLPAAKTAGLGLIDVGAALATLTDTGVPAEEAATRLRMTFALMSAPTGAAATALKEIGLTNTALAVDMHKPNGLLVAVEDLRKHLGNLHSTAGQIAAEDTLVKAFGGGRSSGAIMTLIQEVDRLQTKYASYGTVASRQATFQDAWAKTTEEFSFKMHALGAELQVVAIRVGTVLIPAVLGAVKGLENLAHWTAESVRWLHDHELAVAMVGAAWMAIQWGSIVRLAQGAMLSVRIAFFAAKMEATNAMVAVGGLSGALTRLGWAAVAAVAVYGISKALTELRHAGEGTAKSIDQVMAGLGDKPDMAGIKHAHQQLEDLAKALKDPGKQTMWTPIFDPHWSAHTKDYKKSLQELADAEAKLEQPQRNLRANMDALSSKYRMTTLQVRNFADAHKIDLSQAMDVVSTKFDAAIVSLTHIHLAGGDVVKAYQDLADAQQKLAPTIKDANKTIGEQYDLFDKLPDKIKISGKELLKNITDQTKAMLDEGANVRKLVREGLDPGMIKALVDKGPQYVAAAASLSVKNAQKFGREYHAAVSATLALTLTTARAEAPGPYQAVIDAANAKKTALAKANYAAFVEQLIPALAHAKRISESGSKEVVDVYGRVLQKSAPQELAAYLKTLKDPLRQAVEVALGVGKKGGTDLTVAVADAIVAGTPRAGAGAAKMTAAIQREINALRGTKVTLSVDEIVASATFSAERNALFGHMRAAGGPITGGRPGRDSVPVLAMPDEHMLTVADVQAMGGHGGVFAFRRALHMAAGGPVITDYLRHPPAGLMAGPAEAEASRLIAQTVRLLSLGGASGATASVNAVALETVKLLHRPLVETAAWARRIMFESRGDWAAVNRSDSNWLAGHPSVGGAQVIAGTFAANAGPFRRVGPFLYGVSINPLANSYAGAHYAVGRYGSLSAVDPLVRPIGYDDGGWLPPGYSVAFNGTGRPEPVGDRTGSPAQMRALTHALREVAGRGRAPVVNITVNAPPGMDVRALASEISRRIGTRADLLTRGG